MALRGDGVPWKFRSPSSGTVSIEVPRSSVVRKGTWTWLILPAGALLSWAAYQFADQVSEREARYRFERVAAEAQHRVEIELRAYAQVVRGLQALFSAKAEVTSDEFDRYVTTLDLGARYPAFSALTFARFVRKEERTAFERSLRESGRLGPVMSPAYRIRAPENLPYHFVIDYVYPNVVPGLPTVGIDITADPARRPAIERQVETGELVSSGIPITQVSRELDSNVLPMRVVVYRAGVSLDTPADRWKAVLGSVGAAFKVRVLFDHALRDSSEKLRLRVYDVGAVSEPGSRSSGQGSLIYDSKLPDGYLLSQQLMLQDARFEQRLQVDWATRRWVLQFTSDDGPVSLVDSSWPWVVLLGGLTTTLLIFAWLQALARSSENALASQRAQSNFLANMSHELRTPLNAILGYAQILELARNLDERQLNGVRTIKMSGDHLLALIDDILDLARVEAGKLELYPSDMDVRRFLDDVSEIIGVRAQQKRVAFELTIDPTLPQTVRADEKRLRQVLLNLLGNAVKFTDAGRVELRARRLSSASVAEGEVALLFEIEDTGIGMDSSQLAQLFQPFQQVSDMEHRRGGTGLGLAISRQLVRLMGSDIQVSSVAGQGSVFWFELRVPLTKDAHAPAPADKLPTGYAGPRRKVLVVDDAVENRALLSDVLQPLGFQVVHATDGAQALARADEVKPDVILMDNLMPVLGGLDAIRQLRGTASFQKVPIVAISASASQDDIRRALSAGATDFMAKPFRASALVSMLQKHLGIEFTYE